jgi:hypothetical protein
VNDWTVLYRYRTPVDPDYGGAPSTITLWLDNLGGLVLGMDQADGEKTIAIPLPWREAQILGRELRAKHTCSEGMTGHFADDCVRVRGHDGAHRTSDGRGFSR